MCEFTAPTTPSLTFAKAETFGYSLNGKEFQVCQEGQAKCDSSYSQIVDSYKGTTAKILSGTNSSHTYDFDRRPFLKTVDTGWADGEQDFASNVLTLWGMADLGRSRTDVYTLSLTYTGSDSSAESGSFGLATKDGHGNWINAVDRNKGANKNKRFVAGPWKQGYELGAYGVDPATKTAWAVINYTGDFVVSAFHQ